MSELYGAPSGFIAASNEAHTDAMTRLGMANANAVEMSAKRDQQMFALLSAPGVNSSEPSTPEQLITKIESNAKTLLGAGFAVQGDKMANTASTMRWNLAKIAHDKRLDARSELVQQYQALDKIYGLLSTVDSQESLDKAVQMHDATAPEDDRIPDEFKTYDPVKFAQLRYGTEEGRKTLKIKLQENRQEDLDQIRQDRLALAQANLERLTAQSEANSLRAAARGKTGGPKAKEIGVPPPSLINAAQAMLEQEYGTSLSPDMKQGKELISRGAFAIASRAKALMNPEGGNQGLQPQEALNQAYEAERPNFQTTPGEEGPGVLGVYPFKKPGKTTYRVGGGATSASGGVKPGSPGSQTNPLPAPSDPKQAKEGVWYNSSKFGVGQVRGGRFISAED